MNYLQHEEDAERYVKDFFKENKDKRLVYHDYAHTKSVLKAAKQIANHYQLNEQDYFVLVIAALFHDTGYLIEASDHELSSAKFADEYLAKTGVNEEIRQLVHNAILSTRMPQKPVTLIEKILCDSDLFHLGSADIRKGSKLMHKEVELFCKRDISKNDWRLKDIQFLEAHHYHTDYCNLLLNEQKQRNLEALKAKLKEENPDAVIKRDPNQIFDNKGKKKERPEKGIETMFRITSSNNQRLSDMADNKAQLLITVNSIILSLTVSLLLRRLEDNQFLVIPTFMLLMVSLSTVVVSILSTRPSIPEGIFSEEEIKLKEVNLLFFGNFYNMPIEAYTKGMTSVMRDKEFLYSTLIKDVYSQGVVLGKKYKLIRLAYNLFMFGLVASVMTFIGAYLVAGQY